jgi:PAS domain S-box-containing protein
VSDAEVQRLAEALAASERRLDETQALAHMGSYDWEIASDTNTWSDELYRIYGTEPQSFNASYEKFLSFLHPDDREPVQAAHRTAFETGLPYRTEERIIRPDGEMRLLATTGEVVFAEDGTPLRVRGVCWDITDRRRSEEEVRLAALKLQNAEERRRQALDLNDNLLQGISSTLYALEAGATGMAREAAANTLAAARDMITGLLGAAPDPGDLVREQAAPRVLPSLPVQRQHSAGRSGPRVLLVDDAEDIRAMLRVTLEITGMQIVGEAGTGEDAVRLAATTAPDVVLLDLAMPGMDGLEALPLIREAAPAARVVVMSGFAASHMEATTLALGASAYLEKGTTIHDVGRVIEDLCPPAAPLTPVGAGTRPMHLTAGITPEGACLEEMRSPLTLVAGLVDTIRHQSERLPEDTVVELWETLSRNLAYVSRLLTAYDQPDAAWSHAAEV